MADQPPACGCAEDEPRCDCPCHGPASTAREDGPHGPHSAPQDPDGPRDADTPHTPAHGHGAGAECRASISGRCLRERQSEAACDTDAGECVHGGQPAGWHAAGCARDCAEQHTYQPGRCALAVAPEPEPRVSILRTRTMADGQPSIVTETLTLTALTRRFEEAIRSVPIRLGPNALGMLERGEEVRLSGGEIHGMALTAAVDLTEIWGQTHNLPVGDDALTPAEEARTAQSGVPTPGCDCGHTGMALGWHLRGCRWPGCLPEDQQQALTEDVAREMRGEPAPGATAYDTGSDTPQQAADRLREALHRALRDYGEGDYDPGTGSDYGDQAAVALAVVQPVLDQQAAEIARLKELVAASEAPGHAVRMAATVPDLTRRAERAERERDAARAVLREVLAAFHEAWPPPDLALCRRATVTPDDYDRWRTALCQPEEAPRG